ncbi:MAG: hypothetical protein KF788_07895 [Piscinibacter sp.]|nr:hypothetical protein [Piscinibacter sp.]
MPTSHHRHRRPAWEGDLLFLRWLVAIVAATAVLAFGWPDAPATGAAPAKAAGGKR